MALERDEGIILSSIPYLRGSRILKIFSKEFGLISMLAPRKLQKIPVGSPLTLLEFAYLKKNDLYTLTEVKIAFSHADLKQSYEHLMAAASIAKSLLTSQFPGKPSPKLYLLAVTYLKKISEFSDPTKLAASFQLKLLQHEGVIHLSLTCQKCRAPSSFLCKGESLCKDHAKKESLSFTEEELHSLILLMGLKKFSEIETITAPLPFLEKISKLFFDF